MSQQEAPMPSSIRPDRVVPFPVPTMAVKVDGVAVDLDAADPNLPRWDVVCATTDERIVVVGRPAEKPAIPPGPSIPHDVLAYVRVGPSMLAVNTTAIYSP